MVRSLQHAVPVHLGNQNPVTELHDAVVARLEPVVEALNADVVFREVDQMLFSDRVIGNAKKFACNAKILHIDIDAAEINKNIHTDASVVGDLKTILKESSINLYIRNGAHHILSPLTNIAHIMQSSLQIISYLRICYYSL